MSWLLKILALLSQLQNVQLIQEIEQCLLTNSTASAIWACIVSKLSVAPLTPGTMDHAIAEAAKSMATTAKL